MGRARLLLLVLCSLSLRLAGASIFSEVNCGILQVEIVIDSNSCKVGYPDAATGPALAVARAGGNSMNAYVFASAIGWNRSISEGYSAGSSAVFDATTTLVTPGPERDGFAFLEIIGSSQAVDGYTSGSVSIGSYQWEIPRNHGPVSTIPAPPGFRYPVTLGAPIPIHLRLTASAFGQESTGLVELGAQVSVQIQYRFVETDLVTGVQALEVVTPEPATGALAIAGFAAFAAAGALRLRRFRV